MWTRSGLRLGRRVLAIVAGAAIVALGPAEGTPSKPSDPQIVAAIERRLLSDPLVPGPRFVRREPRR
jgi:hypothetical protein